ncbi:30S ribosomal protein S9 [Patescibacteria group bacterium]|nr:30S ribosomal protein S9 [Patescibacteria group bacterium]
MVAEKTDTKYLKAVGRRKTAAAQVRLYKSTKNSIEVNHKKMEEYFPLRELQYTVNSAIKESGLSQKFKITALLRGGGIVAQADALRHGIARTLVQYDAELRKALKTAGFLKRDPRVKERKKFGLRKARRAPQWKKR